MKNIISIIVIIISLAAFVFIVKPQYTEIKDIEKKGEELEQVLVNAKKLQSLRDSLISKRQDLSKSDIARLEKLIPESADNVHLIIEFQNIANKYNLTLETASAQKDESNESNNQSFDIETRDYGVITLDFSISGAYDDFISFLSDVEDNLRITDLRSMSISGGEGGYSFAITIETYWLKDNI